MDKKAEMKAKLEALKARRKEGRKANTDEVQAEEKRAKLPSNYEAKKRQAEWELEDEKKKKEAEAQGLDYERVKNKERTAMDADAKFRKKKRKQNPDQGMTDHHDAQFRQYQRLTKQIKPDMKGYDKAKEEWKDDATDANSLSYGQHDAVSQKGLDRLVKDLDEQDEKRKNFSRRRAHAGGDISYINERNMRFNKKLDRFYGKVTKEIRDNLERGTAI